MHWIIIKISHVTKLVSCLNRRIKQSTPVILAFHLLLVISQSIFDGKNWNNSGETQPSSSQFTMFLVVILFLFSSRWCSFFACIFLASRLVSNFIYVGVRAHFSSTQFEKKTLLELFFANRLCCYVVDVMSWVEVTYFSVFLGLEVGNIYRFLKFYIMLNNFEEKKINQFSHMYSMSDYNVYWWQNLLCI